MDRTGGSSASSCWPWRTSRSGSLLVARRDRSALVGVAAHRRGRPRSCSRRWRRSTSATRWRRSERRVVAVARVACTVGVGRSARRSSPGRCSSPPAGTVALGARSAARRDGHVGGRRRRSSLELCYTDPSPGPSPVGVQPDRGDRHGRGTVLDVAGDRGDARPSRCWPRSSPSSLLGSSLATAAARQSTTRCPAGCWPGRVVALAGRRAHAWAAIGRRTCRRPTSCPRCSCWPPCRCSWSARSSRWCGPSRCRSRACSHRRLEWTLLAAGIVALYTGVVAGLGRLVGGSGPTWFLVAATGAIAVLVEPARQRVRALADRLVYGSRDDALSLVRQVMAHVSSADDGDELLPGAGRQPRAGDAPRPRRHRRRPRPTAGSGPRRYGLDPAPATGTTTTMHCRVIASRTTARPSAASWSAGRGAVAASPRRRHARTSWPRRWRWR